MSIHRETGLQPQLTEDDAPGAGWLLDEEPLPEEPLPSAAVLPFPPRRGRAGDETRRAPAVRPSEDDAPVKANAFRVAVRLIELAAVLLYLSTAALFDWLTYSGRDHRHLRLLRRRAVRLRRTLEKLGGTFVKVGQQMSIRADVFPKVYCDELKKLQNDVDSKAIPESHIRGVFERQTGRRIEAIFTMPFDFSPIGMASVACVYKARLLTGEEVAVKIRRPGIERLFKTDLAALRWILWTAEFLTVLRPRISATFRSELELMLLEELDFHLEVRYQELFRRYYKRRKKLNTTAPKIYFDLCGRDVIVSELVTGFWMDDLIDRMESGDLSCLDELRAHDIDLKKVAKQLVRGSHYGFFECPFFHGDPHPGNILVQPGNRIVMIDFGACGVFAERERNQFAQMHYYYSREDVGGMVQCVIHLTEPLPPVDLDDLRRALENTWWKGFYGLKSHHAGWQERTSFRLWTGFFHEMRKRQMPLPLNVLRMIRATLLYDTVAARIYPGINVFKEYQKYFDNYARRVQRKVQVSLVRQLLRGPDPDNYVLFRRLLDVGDVLLRRVQIFLRKPEPDFAALVSKGYEIFMITLKWLFTCVTVTLAALLAGIAVEVRNEGTLWIYPKVFIEHLISEMKDPGAQPSESVFVAWLVLLLLVTAKYVHQMWFRLRDKDVGKGPFGSRR